jgi:hypothetical protein
MDGMPHRRGLMRAVFAHRIDARQEAIISAGRRARVG